MISELSLKISSSNSCKSFIIEDTSIYNPVLPITCLQLTVKTPGFKCEHTFEIDKPDFKIKVNLGNLGLQSVNDPNCLKLLPDGNYEIKYSINPNDKLYVEYNYYNTCSIMKDYMSLNCKFFSNRCDLSKKEQEIEIEKLYEIRNLIEQAKISAEYCFDVKTADEFYNEAKSKIKNYDFRNCR